MFVYATIPAAAESTTASGNMYTTNGTANTVTDHIRFLTVASAVRGCAIQALYYTGRDSAATSITGVSLRMMRFATASTVGTAASIRPRDPLAPAAITTAFTLPTIGATPTLQLAVGGGRAGPGGWVAPNPDSMIYLDPNGGANGNVDMLSGSGGTSIQFDCTFEHQE